MADAIIDGIGSGNKAIVDENNRLWTSSNFANVGETSVGNTSNIALASGVDFTGTGELNNYPDVMVSVKTDTTGSLFIEFSVDGTNWDSSLAFKYDPARINPPHVFVKGNRYYRTRFENTGSNQSYFRLQTDYGPFNKLTSPINGTLSENYDAIVARTTDYKYEVAMGKRQGRTTWNKFGYNASIGTTTESIWPVGGSFNLLSTATPINFVSSSTEDTPNGSGCTGLNIWGVDNNFNPSFEQLALSGTTTVTTVGSYIGLNRVSNNVCGVAQENIGSIVGTASSNSTIQAMIPATEGTTQQVIYYSSINHTVLADWLTINVDKNSGGGNPDVTVIGWVYSFDTNSKYEVFRHILNTAASEHLELRPSQPFVIGERQVFWLEATSSAGDTIVNARVSLIEERQT